MMKTFKNIILIAAALMFFCNVYPQDSIKSGQQDSVKIVVLSYKTGEVIDKNENEKYEVLPYTDNIDSIKILWSPAKQYFIRISMQEKSLSKEFQINEQNLIRLTERIELKDAIEKGIYKPGFSEISIDTSGTKMYVKLKNDYFTVMPWAKNPKSNNNFHPMLGVGAGFKYMDMDLSEIKGFYDYVEQTVRSKGYAIVQNSLDEGPNSFYAFNIYLYLLESFGVFFEAGKGLGGSWDSYYTSGSLKYYINFGKTEWFKLYLGGGYTKVGFKGAQSYNATISEISPNGSYWLLDDITTEGNSHGFTLNIGSDAGYFDYNNRFYFTVYADVSYAFFPEKTYNNSITIDNVVYTKTSSTKFNGLMFTSGIKIYF
jgi:hypothetical protein